MHIFRIARNSAETACAQNFHTKKLRKFTVLCSVSILLRMLQNTEKHGTKGKTIPLNGLVMLFCQNQNLLQTEVLFYLEESPCNCIFKN